VSAKRHFFAVGVAMAKCGKRKRSSSALLPRALTRIVVSISTFLMDALDVREDPLGWGRQVPVPFACVQVFLKWVVDFHRWDAQAEDPSTGARLSRVVDVARRMVNTLSRTQRGAELGEALAEQIELCIDLMSASASSSGVDDGPIDTLILHTGLATAVLRQRCFDFVYD